MKNLRLMLIAFVLVLSLAVNVATVAFSSFALILSAAYEMLTGATSVVSELRRDALTKEEKIAKLGKEVDTKNKRSNRLTTELAARDKQLINLQKEVHLASNNSTRLAKDLSSKTKEVTRLSGKLVEKDGRIGELTALLADPQITYRNGQFPLSEAVDDTVERISRRTAIGSGRNVSAVFAEGIPFLGIGVAGAVTGYELKDGCDTLKDLRELELAINPNSKFSEDAKVACGKEVPSRDEVWEVVSNSPGDAWDGVKSYLPELPEWSVSDGWERAKHLAWVGWYRIGDGFDQTWRRMFGN